MTRHRTADKNIIFIRKYFFFFLAFQLYTVTAHSSCHTHTFKYTWSIRRVTYWTRGTWTVMLAMRLAAYTMETMTFYNTLETFTLGSTNYLYTIAFGKYVYSDWFTKFFLYFAIADFLNECKTALVIAQLKVGGSHGLTFLPDPEQKWNGGSM